MSFSSQSERATDPNGRDAAVATALYAALGSLDVQLEAELERYRSVRDLEETQEPSDRPVEIPAATIAAASLAPDAIAPSPEVETPDAADVADAASLANETEMPDPFELSDGDSLGGEASDIDASLQDSEAAIAETQSADATPPDGYLASSEALLAADRRRRSKRNVSPLGVGAVLLLLLASATVGYILVNPESLDRLGWRAWFERDAEPDVEPVAEADEESSEPDLPTSPNLAAEEFVDIDIDTLSELESPATPSPAPAPPPTPTPSPTPANSLDNLANTLAPETNPAASPATSPAPSPASDIASPLPQATDDPNYIGFYFVVVNEGNDTALGRVRASNPDAYFDEIAGARRIQVGAFDNFAVASEVAARLTAQGLPAQVYRP
ncbi:MAG: hypothetical protein ACFB9N_04920 [Geitlerinemataceae cyanobacterium]